MNYEEILVFYQSKIQKEAFEEQIFIDTFKLFLVEDDQLNDIENLYKIQIASKKIPDTD